VNEKWCDWHVLIVAGTETDDREVDVLHPGCPFSFTWEAGGHRFDHACLIAFEIENVGFDTLLNDHGDGWYRARMRMVSVPGFDFFTEIDSEYEVERLEVAS
jgi:hypothetical protein